MSVAPPPTPNPAGNLASYLDAVSDANFSAINAFGSFLGTLADIGGAIALIESLVSEFNPNQQDQYLARRLIALSQARPYLVAARSSHGDFGPRFAHRPRHLGACRPLSFCGAARA